jgi:transposase
MNDQQRWYVGVDWASENHHVRITDGEGRTIGEKIFKHSGEGLAAMANWLMAVSGAESPGQIHIAIEVPHGPVAETLLERGFHVYAINPKQLDRFRGRYTLAGAKDDSRDALVMAAALRTDPHCLRKLEAANPAVIELREWSRIGDDLTAERNRLTNRLREQLWRYFPALLELDSDLGAEWLLELCETAPSPAKAARIGEATIARLLKRHRIRRFDAALVLSVLRQPAVTLLAGTLDAVTGHIATLIPRIRLLNRQRAAARKRLDELTARLAEPVTAKEQENEPGQPKAQHDATILASLPGVGRIVLATLLAEAWDALLRRDYHALRALCGVAPVTKSSGKSRIVIRRLACHPRLANAIYHWARVAIQHGQLSRLKYSALRKKGHSHGRALRSVAGRLLGVACAMLKAGTLFDPAKQCKNTPC